MSFVLLHRRPDDTFIIDKGTGPYHVIPGDPLFDAVAAAADGVTLPPEPLPALPPGIMPLDVYRMAIEAHVDAVARQRGYSSAVSCASYRDSTNATWAAEAAAFIAWRDAVWSQVVALLNNVPSPAPTVEAVIAGLPAIAWPT